MLANFLEERYSYENLQYTYRKKQEFTPIKEGEAKIYACGPTVYNYIHIGNARPLCVFDTLRRYMKYIGYKVTFVQNFTDIDDKIIKRQMKNQQIIYLCLKIYRRVQNRCKRAQHKGSGHSPESNGKYRANYKYGVKTYIKGICLCCVEWGRLF